MGCDIHSIAQVFKGKHNAETSYGVYTYGRDHWQTVEGSIIEEPRCYEDFAMLADVRNGSDSEWGGDAGFTFEPISKPKGLPPDLETLNDGVDVEVEGWVDGCQEVEPEETACPHCGRDYEDVETKYYKWLGSHSHSWVTLAELKQYAASVANKKAHKVGYIKAESYKAWDKVSPLWAYSTGIQGPKIVKVTPEQFADMHNIDPSVDVYVKAEWDVSYMECSNIPKYIAQLEKIAKENEVSDENIRMVFGFDS